MNKVGCVLQIVISSEFHPWGSIKKARVLSKQSVDPQVRENLANDAKAEKDKLAGEKEELEAQLETIRIEKEMV